MLPHAHECLHGLKATKMSFKDEESSLSPGMAGELRIMSPFQEGDPGA